MLVHKPTRIRRRMMEGGRWNKYETLFRLLKDTCPLNASHTNVGKDSFSSTYFYPVRPLVTHCRNNWKAVETITLIHYREVAGLNPGPRYLLDYFSSNLLVAKLYCCCWCLRDPIMNGKNVSCGRVCKGIGNQVLEAYLPTYLTYIPTYLSYIPTLPTYIHTYLP